FNIKQLRVDNGTEFTSNEFKKFCEKSGIKLTFGNAYSSKSGGKIERLNGTIKQLIKCNIVRDNSSKWVDHVEQAVFTYNTSPHSAINNMSPYELFIKLSNNVSNPIPLKPDDLRDIIENQPNFPYFNVGDTVLKKIDRIGRKTEDSMKPNFDGPYKIVEAAEHRKSFTLESLYGASVRSHYDKLKKLKTPPLWLEKNHFFQKYLWNFYPTNYIEENNINLDQNNYNFDNKYTNSDMSIHQNTPQDYHKDYTLKYKDNKTTNHIFTNPRKRLVQERVNMTWQSDDCNSYSSDEGEIKYFTPLINKLTVKPVSFTNLPIPKSPVNNNCIKIKLLPNLSNNNLSYMMSHPAMNSSNIEENIKIKSNLINDFITITENEEYNLNQTFNNSTTDVTNNTLNISFSPPKTIENIVSENNPILFSRGSQAEWTVVGSGDELRYLQNILELNNTDVFLHPHLKYALYQESLAFDFACKEAVVTINHVAGTGGHVRNFNVGSDRTALSKNFGKERRLWRNGASQHMPLGRYIQGNGLNRTHFAVKQLLTRQIVNLLRMNDETIHRHSSPIIHKPVPRYCFPPPAINSNIERNIPLNTDTQQYPRNKHPIITLEPQASNNTIPVRVPITKPSLKRNHSPTLDLNILSPISLNNSCSSLEKSSNKVTSFIHDPPTLLKKANSSNSSPLSKRPRIEIPPISKLTISDSYDESIENVVERHCKILENSLRSYRIPKKQPSVLIPKLPFIHIRLVGDSTAHAVFKNLKNIPPNFKLTVSSIKEPNLANCINDLISDAAIAHDDLNQDERLCYVLLAGQQDFTKKTGKSNYEITTSLNINELINNYKRSDLFFSDNCMPKVNIVWTIPLIVDFKRYCGHKHKSYKYDLSETIDRNIFEKSIALRNFNLEIQKYMMSQNNNFINLDFLSDQMTEFNTNMPNLLSGRNSSVTFPSYNYTIDGCHLNATGANRFWDILKPMIERLFY
ncbi:unnamed protein product, partial [Rotaria magnacalcarata]